MMQIQRNITNVNCSNGNVPKYIIIHDTGNQDRGANALRHALLFKNPVAKVSYHIVVDDYRAIQCVEFNNKAYHAGKKYGQASVPEANNSNSIGISMCVNRDCNKQKAYKNLIDVTRQMMKQFNIPIERVIRHYDACKKECPQWIMDNKLWDDFKKNLVSNMIGDDEDMIPTVKLAACNDSKIKNAMIEYIKGLQGCVKMSQTGIATQELCTRLPRFNGGEEKGSASILQEILQLKGYLSKDKIQPLGTSVRNALDRFKKDIGLPSTTELTNPLIWMKLLEY